MYTESSLNWLFDEFGYRPIAAWWFGADVFDLYRGVAVGLLRDGGLASLVDQWSRMMLPAMDDMQLALDKRKLSSEVHYVLALDRGTRQPVWPPVSPGTKPERQTRPAGAVRRPRRGQRVTAS